jgi:hypothetical protein
MSPAGLTRMATSVSDISVRGISWDRGPRSGLREAVLHLPLLLSFLLSHVGEVFRDRLGAERNFADSLSPSRWSSSYRRTRYFTPARSSAGLRQTLDAVNGQLHVGAVLLQSTGDDPLFLVRHGLDGNVEARWRRAHTHPLA